MTSHDYNALHLEALGVHLQGGDTAILVGAGSSIACGYPGWDGFLNTLESALRKHLSQTEIDAIRRNDLRIQLDQFAKRLGPAYAEAFHQVFRPKETGLRTPEWIRLLFDLNARYLLTTNYTCELEEAARYHPATPLGVTPRFVRWYDSKAFAQVLRHIGGQLQLLYLHGRYDDRPDLEYDTQGLKWSQIVLGEISYQYGYEYPGIIRERLKAIFQTCTLLIVGASLRDEDLTGTFRVVKALAGVGAVPHYAVLPLAPNQDPMFAAITYVDRFAIQPLFYDLRVNAAGHEDHRAMENVLREIVERATPEQRVTISSTVAAVGGGFEYSPRPRVVHPLLQAVDFEPRPPYRRALDNFIVQEEGGVLVLVGIGGSGKTAIVRDALDDHIRERSNVPLEGLFVWSFYENTSTPEFFRNLLNYVTHSSVEERATENESYEQLRRSLNPNQRLLIVLDGLERIQLDQPRSVQMYGELESPVLRRFLLWLVQNPVCTRAILTTRFPLVDFEAEKPTGRVRVLDVDSLTRPQARSVLRHRGVHGSDVDLDILIDHFGTHALTTQHLGGVIATYLGGDARRFAELGQGPLTRYSAGQAGVKLARVLAAYDTYLERTEPEVRDALQCVAIFHRPVSAEILANIFSKPGRELRAGRLAGKTFADVVGYVRRLVSLRLLSEEWLGNETVYSIHPAVRSAVLEGIGARASQLAGVAREELELSLERLTGKPGAHLTAGAQDFIQELIGFCIDEGQLDRAFELYWTRLKGKITGYSRGERIVRRLLGATDDQPNTERWRRIRQELVGFLVPLGGLREALALLRSLTAPGLVQLDGFDNAVSLYVTLSSVLFLIGQLSQAKVSADAAASAAYGVEGRKDRMFYFERANYALGMCMFVTGKVKSAIGHFVHSRWCQNMFDKANDVLYGDPGFELQLGLVRCGLAREGLQQAEAALQVNQKRGWDEYVARTHAVMAEYLRQLSRLTDAERCLKEAKEWALSSGHEELLLLTRLFEARQYLDLQRTDAAREEASEGLRAAHTFGFGLLQIDLKNVLADISIASGQFEVALQKATESLEEATKCGFLWGRLDALTLLGRVFNQIGDRSKKAAFNMEAKNLRTQVRVTADMLHLLLPTTKLDLNSGAPRAL